MGLKYVVNNLILNNFSFSVQLDLVFELFAKNFLYHTINSP